MLQTMFPILKLNFDLANNFAVKFYYFVHSRHLQVLFGTSLNGFSQQEAELRHFFEQLDFFRLENSMKFSL